MGLTKPCSQTTYKTGRRAHWYVFELDVCVFSFPIWLAFVEFRWTRLFVIPLAPCLLGRSSFILSFFSCLRVGITLQWTIGLLLYFCVHIADILVCIRSVCGSFVLCTI